MASMIEISCLTTKRRPTYISFSGSGFLAIYQLGVVQALQDNAPSTLSDAPQCYGASAGSIVAAAVVCGSNIAHVRNEIQGFARFKKRHSLGLYSIVYVYKWIERTLRRSLPEDAHRRANGRLHISVTRVPDGKNIIISEFHSNEDLIEALLCSCFVPGYCGLFPPRFKGVVSASFLSKGEKVSPLRENPWDLVSYRRTKPYATQHCCRKHYVDGGLTNMQPTHDSCRTLTISPFASEADICPSDLSSTILFDVVINKLSIQLNLPNVIRLANALFPRNGEILNKAYEHGYQDAIYYLVKNCILCVSPSRMDDPDYTSELHIKNGTCQQIENDWVEHEDDIALSWSLEDPIQLRNPELIHPEEESIMGFPVSLELLTYPSFHEDILDSFLWTTMLYLGLMGSLDMNLRPGMLPYLLLPISLAVWIVASFVKSFQHWISQAAELCYWLWQDFKPVSMFFINIMLATLRKGLGHDMSSDCGRKPAYAEETQVDTVRTRKLHTERTQAKSRTQKRIARLQR